MAQAYQTMRHLMGHTDDLPPLSSQRTPLSDAEQRINNIIVNALRSSRENAFCDRLRRMFAAQPLEVDLELPLSSPEKEYFQAPWHLSIEQLQYLCNKTIAIYSKYNQYTLEKLYNFLFDQ
jgi:hypothetical protein